VKRHDSLKRQDSIHGEGVRSQLSLDASQIWKLLCLSIEHSLYLLFLSTKVEPDRMHSSFYIVDESPESRRCYNSQRMITVHYRNLCIAIATYMAYFLHTGDKGKLLNGSDDIRSNKYPRDMRLERLLGVWFGVCSSSLSLRNF
jgi:hypothetical protein